MSDEEWSATDRFIELVEEGGEEAVLEEIRKQLGYNKYGYKVVFTDEEGNEL